MYTRIAVAENNRVIVTRNNRVSRLLTPGVYRLFELPMLRVGIEWHDLRSPVLKSKWTRFLIEKRPDLISQHFIAIETGSLDLAMISLNGTLYDVILPQKTVLFWKDCGKITVETVNIGVDDDLELTPDPVTLVEDEDDWIFESQAES